MCHLCDVSCMQGCRCTGFNGSCSAVAQLPVLPVLQAVTTAVGHKLGLGSSLFAVSLAFTLVVMYDAANVRWHAGKGMQSHHSLLLTMQTCSYQAVPATCSTYIYCRWRCLDLAIPGTDGSAAGWPAGKQAEVLNIVMEDLLEGHPISEKKMKEVLGHTPLQVRRSACRPAGGLRLHHMSSASMRQAFVAAAVEPEITVCRCCAELRWACWSACFTPRHFQHFQVEPAQNARMINCK